MPIRKYLIFTVTIFLTSNTYAAGKFYKWTDSNGQVHYSQVAPHSKDTSAENITKIGGKSGSVKMQPYEKGKYLYCGSIELPNAHLTDTLIIKNIKLGLKEWMKSLTEAENEYNKILVSQQNIKKTSKFRQIKKHFEETSCRVTWATKRLKHLTSTSYKNKIILDKLENRYYHLRDEKELKCAFSNFGSTPGILVGDEAQAHTDCTKRYSGEMGKIRKTLKNRRKIKYKPKRIRQ